VPLVLTPSEAPTYRMNQKSDEPHAPRESLHFGEILRPRTKGLALMLDESRAAAAAAAMTGGRYAATGGYFSRVVDMTVAYTDADGKPLQGSALGEARGEGEWSFDILGFRV